MLQGWILSERLSQHRLPEQLLLVWNDDLRRQPTKFNAEPATLSGQKTAGGPRAFVESAPFNRNPFVP